MQLAKKIGRQPDVKGFLSASSPPLFLSFCPLDIPPPYLIPLRGERKESIKEGLF